MNGRWSQGTKVMGATLILDVIELDGWRYSRPLFQNYTKRVDRSVLRQYILCCKDVSSPAQLSV